MKPFKAATGLSNWLLRISLVLSLLLSSFPNLSPIDLSSMNFYFAAAFAVLAVMLLIGGVLSKTGLTVVSALIIVVLFVALIVIQFKGTIGIIQAQQLLLASVAFLFVCRGNS